MWLSKRQRQYIIRLFIIIVAVGCIKVRRQYDVTLPALPSAAQRSQNSVFELRNSVLAGVPTNDLNSFLEDVRQELNDREFTDTKSATPTSSDLLGGKLETSIEKVVTRICIKTLSISPNGPNSLQLALSLSTCGVHVDLLAARAVLRPPGKLSGKALKILVNQFTVTDPNQSRDFKLLAQILVNDDGTIQLGEKATLQGLEDLADPKSFHYKVDNSMDGEGLRYFEKSSEEISKLLVTQILQASQGYLQSSVRDAFSRTFKKLSSLVNERKLGNASWSWKFQLGNIAAFLNSKLNGIAGDKAIVAALNPDFAIRGDILALTKYCNTTSFGFFPDPKPSWLRGLPMQQYLDYSEISVDPKSNTNSSQFNTAISVPWPTLNFVLWKALGTEGECNWSYDAGGDKKLAVKIKYNSQWQVDFYRPGAGILGSGSSSGSNSQNDFTQSLVVLGPKLTLTFDSPLITKIVATLKEQGFANDIEGLIKPEYTLDSIEYPLSLLFDQVAHTARFAVQNENKYSAKTSMTIEDVVDDVIEQLRHQPTFSSANLKEKTRLLANSTLIAVMNYRLGKTLHDSLLKLQDSANRVLVETKSIHLTEKSLQIKVLTSIPNQANLQLTAGATELKPSPIYLRKNPANLALDEPITATSTMTRDEAITGLSSLGLPTFLDANSEAAVGNLKDRATKSGLKCNDVQHISLPIDDNTSTIAAYFSCYLGLSSIEYRIHSEKAATDLATVAGPVVYLHARFQQGLLSNGTPDSTSAIPKFSVVKSKLQKPTSETIKNGLFSSNWSIGNLRIVLNGVCPKFDVDGKCDESDRVLTGYIIWSE